MSRKKEKAEITVDMLRAFVILSETLNLTKTSEILGATRQTVRRHISDLERIKGEALFSLEKHEYALTSYGTDSVADAKSILRQIELWSGHSGLVRRSSRWLESAQYMDGSDREFFSQQHPISTLWTNGLPIMKRTLSAWGSALTQIEETAMSKVRPYLVIYRKSPKGWICAEIGEQSAYAKWFGWTWSKSAIGKLSQEDNAGDNFNDFIASAYARIYSESGVRLDHLYAHLPRESSDHPVPVSFQRLLLGCVFPDNTPALAVLILMTNRIDISALRDSQICAVPEDLVMDFDI